MQVNKPNLFGPDWPAPESVKAASTYRFGGSSTAPWDSFNLAAHVEDDYQSVVRNRELLMSALGVNQICWLNQVHGTDILNTAEVDLKNAPPQADASWSNSPNHVCAVMTADCLPVLVCNEQGSKVLAAHAGWRGLVKGILAKALMATGFQPAETLLWFGPAIGPDAYQVSKDLLEAFRESEIYAGTDISSAFTPDGADHYLCNLYRLARIQLEKCGYSRIFGGDQCTYSQPGDYFSYRRDGQTGRMASLIWLDR